PIAGCPPRSSKWPSATPHRPPPAGPWSGRCDGVPPRWRRKGAFHRQAHAPVGHRLLDGRGDAQLVPQPVQHPAAAQRPALDKPQRDISLLRLAPEGLFGGEEAFDAADQPLELFAVHLLFAAEGPQHLGLRPARLGMPEVVGQLDVADDGAISIFALHGTDVHAYAIRHLFILIVHWISIRVPTGYPCVLGLKRQETAPWRGFGQDMCLQSVKLGSK